MMTMMAATAHADHKSDVDNWHKDRVARLQAEGGWLSLVGLSWLQEGENRVGSDDAAQVKFPSSAPGSIGTFVRTGEKVVFRAAKGVAVTVDGKPVESIDALSDEKGAPTTFKTGSFTFHLIKRGAKLGVRIKDANAATRTGFKGIERYPVDGKWKVTARFEAFPDKRTLKIPTVIGTVEDMVAPGTVVFSVDGKPYRLDPVIEEGSDELFFIFADETSGKETYGAGRFLYAPMPKDGVVVIDFNRAYNPPCAFTKFATCPLPPAQNRMKVAVTAGEKKYGDH